jgi:DNA repair protein RadD
MLRPYQQDCLDKLLWARTLPGNDLISVAQGGGKSHIIAEYAKAINEPVLILQPSRELVVQNRSKLLECVPKEEIGIYSASLNSKIIAKFTFATIGSIYKKPDDFKHFHTVIIDEAHMLNMKRQGSMLTSFLKEIGSPKVVGFTATPYRQVQQSIRHSEYFVESITMTKMINRMWGADNKVFWDRLLFTISTQELIDLGYLVPLTYINQKLIDQMAIPLNISKSDFNLPKYEEMIWNQMNRIQYAIERCRDYYRSTLVFCTSVEQAELLKGNIADAAIVTAYTKKTDRKRIINDFKAGKIPVVLNVGCLTTGFDHPSLDCIVLLRPTRSIGLYLQMLGRGSRIAPNKKTCIVVDFTDTVNKLGKIETFKVAQVENKWNIVSEKRPTGYHGVTLYKFDIITGF